MLEDLWRKELLEPGQRIDIKTPKMRSFEPKVTNRHGIRFKLMVTKDPGAGQAYLISAGSSMLRFTAAFLQTGGLWQAHSDGVYRCQFPPPQITLSI